LHERAVDEESARYIPPHQGLRPYVPLAEDETGKAEILIDQQLDERVGVPWPEQLARALGRSRLLVPVPA